MQKILSVDIDDCILPMMPSWLNYCNRVSGKYLTFYDVSFSYDLTKHFEEIKPMRFWENNQLYDFREPYPEAVDLLTSLNDAGWEVGFTSYCKKDHFSSKCKMINKWFPFRSFIMATKEKGYVKCTHAIDDRNKYCNQYPGDVKCIRIDTPYKQDEQPTRDILVARDWYEIERILKEEM